MYFLYCPHNILKLRLVEKFEDSDFCLSWKIRRIVNTGHGVAGWQKLTEAEEQFSSWGAHIYSPNCFFIFMLTDWFCWLCVCQTWLRPWVHFKITHISFHLGTKPSYTYLETIDSCLRFIISFANPGILELIF